MFSKTLKRAFLSTLMVASVSCVGILSNMTPSAYAATPTTAKLIDNSKSYIGTAYRYGSKPGNTKSFDCSSYTLYMFQLSNYDLPRSSVAQAKVGKKVSRSNLSQGDLVFFNTNGRGISHVGIYVGNNNFIHASTDRGVIISALDQPYYNKRYVTARRVSLPEVEPAANTIVAGMTNTPQPGDANGTDPSGSAEGSQPAASSPIPGEGAGVADSAETAPIEEGTNAAGATSGDANAADPNLAASIVNPTLAGIAPAVGTVQAPTLAMNGSSSPFARLLQLARYQQSPFLPLLFTEQQADELG
jgi:hypothetical protein